MMNHLADSTTRPVAQRKAGTDMVRLWLKLLACSGTIERHLRQRFRSEFGVTLPQFDLMSALDRTDRPQSMSEVSDHLMVSNGNVTGLVDRLVRDGLVRRSNCGDDRRVQLISLTDDGCEIFAEMAKTHRHWISGLLDDLTAAEINTLSDLLQRTRASIDARR